MMLVRITSLLVVVSAVIAGPAFVNTERDSLVVNRQNSEWSDVQSKCKQFDHKMSLM